MDSRFYIGMPGIYLLHSARQNLFQTVWPCTSLKFQVTNCVLLTWDRDTSREEGKKHCGGGVDAGLGKSQRGEG